MHLTQEVGWLMLQVQSVITKSILSQMSSLGTPLQRERREMMVIFNSAKFDRVSEAMARVGRG